MKNFTRICLAGLILTTAIAMAAAGEKDSTIPDYSLLPRNEVPREFTWAIEDIYPSTEAWETDFTKLEKMILAIDEMVPGWTTSAEKMAAMLNHIMKCRILGGTLFAYASHNSNTDLGNQRFQKMKGAIRNLLIKMRSRLSFFDSDVLSLGRETFLRYLQANPDLEPYRFTIEGILRLQDHVLPAEQQNIVALTGLFAGTSSQASTMLNNVDIPPPSLTLSDGETVTLNYANYVKFRGSGNRQDRRNVMRSFWKNHKQFENTLATLLNGGVKQDFFISEVYGYADCLEARLYAEAIDPGVYHTLIRTVRQNLAPLHRYLELKKEMLGLDPFLYEDIYASAVPHVDKRFTFSEAREIILSMMKPLGMKYRAGLRKAFENRWIDIYPNKGKQSGAYSSGVYGVHPFIKMNYDGSYGNLSTLAHELGHALHSYFSQQTQHYANASYPTFLAEIASTFNENMLVDFLLKNEKDDLFKLFIIDGYLERIRGTLHRQTLFAEFELATHRRVENGHTLTADWLNETYLQLTRDYYGHNSGIVEVGDFIANEWSAIPHFYRNFYVFQYSTGIIASMALTEMVVKGNIPERERYLRFLMAGGSAYPLETLKQAGVDMTTPQPILAAMQRMESLVNHMERLIQRLK